MSVASRERPIHTAPRRSAGNTPRLDGRASAALMLGGAGLFVFNVLFGPIAIVLGLRAARNPAGGRFGRIGGRLGVTLGVLDLLVWIVLLLVRLGGDGLSWQFGG
ncbi:hypothetical protein CO540_00670 [Micromonospora sp. WMMA2032]|uniref:hypothetical protein n=1 Tax=Micromonospora TaxID=1873 RepID=UPI000C058F0B|nr:hypothetical protein [Micromonospora sp. WMMA2032]ATO12538.1 hypothetical protein CO540_00670 [Micromonospora sp. WMMA2032]